MGDDAFGPWALQQLAARWDLPDSVQFLDAGTPGPELGHYVTGLDGLIVLDTVRGGDRPPGTVLLYDRDQILENPPHPRMGPHDPSLKDALLTAEMFEGSPERVLLVGVVPEKVELGAGLSEAVRGALPEVERAVVEALRGWGVELMERMEPDEVDVWWEVEAS